MLVACPRPVPQGEKGASGLPTGRGEEPPPAGETLTEVEQTLPLYPGSTRTGPGVYRTNDSLETVKGYYIQLLKVTPEVRGMYNEVTVFVTPEGELQLLAIEGAEGGTEIRFVEK
jgi:hypothetical protein